MSIPRWLYGVLAPALVLPACTTKVTLQTVRTQAARDLQCDEEKVNVLRLDETKKLYRAYGCGNKKSYVCDKWDSYNQKPVCREAEE